MTLGTFFIHDLYSCSLAVKSDMPATVKLINHAFRYQDDAKGESRISEESLTKRIKETEFYVFKDENRKIVSCIYIDRLAMALHFGLFAVDDELRGSGLAVLIMQSIEQYAIGLGKKYIELDYMSLSPWLKSYYEKYGYHETGEIEDIGWCRLIRMVKPLPSVR